MSILETFRIPVTAVAASVLAAAAMPLPAQDRYAPGADELEIHRITLQDAVRIYVTPFANWNAGVSLDPYVRLSADSRFAANSGRRLARKAIDELLRATSLRLVCEPVSDNACRGTVRGTVFRLTQSSFTGGDSAQAVVLATAARSEFDRTIVVPQIRYYVYQLERQGGEWTITRAQRGLPFLPPSAVSAGQQ
jgi:hypothetical protein